MFPTHWVYDDGTVKPDGSPVALESCLQNRLDDQEWISKDRSARFARRLGKPMLKSKEARWDSKRLKILSTLYMQNGRWRMEDSYPPPPNGIDQGELLRLCALDIAHAIATESPALIDDFILDAAHDDTQNAYKIARRWVLRDFDPECSLYFSTYLGDATLNALIAHTLEPIFEELDRPKIVELINTVDRDKNSHAYRILIDSKVMNLHYKEIIKDIDMSLGTQGIRSRAHYFAQIVQTLPAEKQADANELISGWLSSGEVVEKLFALRVVGLWVLWNNRIPDDQPPHELFAFMDLVLKHSLRDSRLIDGPQYPDSTIHALAVQLILSHDQIGLASFPLIGEMVNQSSIPYLNINAFYHQDDWTDDSFKAWLEAFGQLAHASNPEYRIWMIDHFPTRSDSAYEEQLIEVAASMLDDQDEDIGVQARKILWDRGIDLP